MTPHLVAPKPRARPSSNPPGGVVPRSAHPLRTATRLPCWSPWCCPRSAPTRASTRSPALWAAAVTPEAMSHLPVAAIEEIIRPCGLAHKRRGLSPVVPPARRAVRGTGAADLGGVGGAAGVGHKTASVMMAQAFGLPAFPVDTTLPAAQRWRLSDGRSVERTERDLKRLFPREHWNQLHLRFIYYGRAHCTARVARTVCEICRARCSGRKRTAVRRIGPRPAGRFPCCQARRNKNATGLELTCCADSRVDPGKP